MTGELAPWAVPAPGVDDALRTRKSIRAFLPHAIPRATIEDILRVASRSPSGTNTQPWIVHVLAGGDLRRLISAIARELPGLDPKKTDTELEPDYPAVWPSPYLERRRKVGWDLYTLLGIKRGEHDRITAQRNRNFEFFGAPVGLVFSIDSRRRQGSWLDYGMYLQGVMLAARARIGDLPAGRIHVLLEPDRAAPAAVCASAGGVRHGHGVCGSSRARQHARDR